MNLLESQLHEHLLTFKNLQKLLPQIDNAAKIIKECIRNGNKIVVCGNGGSAADAQHFAAELTGHFEKERPPLPALALTTDTSALTAIGNDYKYEDVFSRQLQALGQKGDVLIAISTSGNSKNVVRASQMAHEKGMSVVYLTGEKGGLFNDVAPDPNLVLKAPSNVVSRIQECHIFILHYFCKYLDENS